MKKSIITFFFAISFLTISAQILVNNGSSWKYLDDGSNQSAIWTSIGFNDSTWSTGFAQLGFGDGDETTTLTSGYITYYFRKTFNVTNPATLNGLNINLLRDDGAVIYINGIEVARSNMPTGNINYTTFASSTIAGTAENIFHLINIPSDILVSGNNVIAVEIHQRSTTSSDISFDLKLEFANYSVNVFRKKPIVLYPGVNSEMLLAWQLNQTEVCQLDWGMDTNYSDGSYTSNEYGSSNQHKYQITNLLPGTKYYYRISCNGSVFENSFISGKNDSDTSFSFYAYGDTRSQPNKHDDVALQILNQILNDPDSQTFIVNSGDLVANGDIETDWDNQFFAQQYTNITEMVSRLPFLSAVGNHEGNGILFAKYFPYPMFPSPTDAYFSFDYANVHFVVIDQFTNYSVGSTQYNWIVNDLQNTTKPWKFALLHKPGWTAGAHPNDLNVQNILQPVFEQNGVSVVITGHNHYYARAIVNGIQHITTGGGGAPLYQVEQPNAENIVTTDISHHFLKINILNNNNLSIEAIRENGTIIETTNISNLNTTAVNQQVNYNLVNIYSDKNDVIINCKVKNLNAKIYDINGKIVSDKLLKLGKNKISVAITGIYIVKIKMPNNNILAEKVLLN